MVISHAEQIRCCADKSTYRGIAYQAWMNCKGVWIISINLNTQKEQLGRFDWRSLIDKTDIACFESENFVFSPNLQRLTGRLCAKLALGWLNGEEPEANVIEISQTPANWGQPLSPSGYVSISHSGDWVVAAAARNPVGIDIQQIRGFGESALEYVFSAQERRDCEPQELTLVWSLKEAYLKALGRSLMPYAMYLEAGLCGDKRFVEDSYSTSSKAVNLSRRQQVECEFYDGYALAVCLIESGTLQRGTEVFGDSNTCST